MFFSHGMSFSGTPLICVAIGFHIRLGTKVRLAGLACTGRLCVCAPRAIAVQVGWQCRMGWHRWA